MYLEQKQYQRVNEDYTAITSTAMIAKIGMSKNITASMLGLIFFCGRTISIK